MAYKILKGLVLVSAAYFCGKCSVDIPVVREAYVHKENYGTSLKIKFSDHSSVLLYPVPGTEKLPIYVRDRIPVTNTATLEQQVRPDW